MKKLWIIGFVALSVAVSGCNANGDGREGNSAGTNSLVKVKNTAIDDEDRKSGQKAARHLADLAAGIPEVNGATAVVLGDYAVVGIDVNSRLDRSRVESIKYSVAESLKHDRHGANAVVIADPDIYARLVAMGQQIQDGRPAAGIMDELAAIVGRVVPEVPSDLMDNENAEPTKQNNGQINNKEEKTIRNTQKEESKNHLQRKQVEEGNGNRP